jgi:hypothetical protein
VCLGTGVVDKPVARDRTRDLLVATRPPESVVPRRSPIALLWSERLYCLCPRKYGIMNTGMKSWLYSQR